MIEGVVVHPHRAGRPGGGRRLGVALGGGSARGYAHIGVLASLERGGMTPDVVVGTSFGAVIGALYAMGRTPAELTRVARAQRRRDVLPHILDLGVARGALLAGDRLEAYFDRLVEGRHFADLPRTFAVVATDLETGARVVLREGALASALRASASLPGVFAPARRGGRRLIDGGIGTPVPLDTLLGFDVDVALGVAVGIERRDSRAVRAVRRVLATPTGGLTQRALGQCDSSGAWGGLARAVALTVAAWSTPEAGACVVSVDACERVHVDTRPPISWLRFDRAGAAIDAGHAAMEAAWPRLRLALERGAPVGA
jgi:NTE family protein